MNKIKQYITIYYNINKKYNQLNTVILKTIINN